MKKHILSLFCIGVALLTASHILAENAENYPADISGQNAQLPEYYVGHSYDYPDFERSNNKSKWVVTNMKGDSPRANAQPVKVTSELAPQGNIKYSVKNIADNSFQTAWAEGSEDYGIGEKITMKVKSNCFKLSDGTKYCYPLSGMFIANGYVGSRSEWNDNSRVKRLKMYVDGVPVAYLNFNDEYNVQTIFFDEPINADKDIEITFEIIEVYPGTESKNTAITELDLMYNVY